MKIEWNPIYRGVILIFCLSLFWGCSENEKALGKYYFPPTHQIYIYSSNDSIGKEYWEVKSNNEKSIYTKVYDGAFDVQQESFEKIYTNGINLEKINMHHNDEIINPMIESGFVFPFDEVDSNEVVFYRIKWQLPEIEDRIVMYELIRNRRFVGYEMQEVFGEALECAKFKLDERIISDMDGSIELSTTGVEYYAKNIGLVYRQRKVTEDLQLEQKLLEIITPDEFNSLKD